MGMRGRADCQRTDKLQCDPLTEASGGFEAPLASWETSSKENAITVQQRQSIREVAQKVGFSAATGSRTVNGVRRVDPGIAARVRSAIDEVG